MPPYGLYSLANTPEELLQGYGTVRGYDTDPAFGNLKTDIRFQPAPFTGARPFQNMFDLSPAYFEGTNLGFDADLYNPSFGGVSGYQTDADDVEMISEEEKKAKTGIETLLGFLQNIPTPLNLIRGGLESLSGLNQRIQGSDFGRSKTLVEFLQKRRERKQAERAQKAMPNVYELAREEGFTNDRGGFSTDRADDAGTSEGSGQFSPSTSRGRSGY